MADHRVLVTGARPWKRPDIIAAAFASVQPTGRPVLVHGQCDPQHPDTRKPIPWELAKRVSWEVQGRYWGADWLSEWVVINQRLGWVIERHPAQWARCGRGAGFLRNSDMAGLGAAECHAFLAAAYRNAGSLDCAVKAYRAGIPTTCWCDACGPGALNAPCEEHSLDEVRATWRRKVASPSPALWHGRMQR